MKRVVTKKYAPSGTLLRNKRMAPTNNVTHDETTKPSKLRRLTKARRQEIKHLDIHLRAKHHLHRLGPTTPFTVYSFIIDDEARQRAPRQHDRRKKEWVFEKRYSEFYDLKTKLLSLITLWENAHHAEHKKSDTAFTSLLNSLRRPLQHRFPRKHMRCDSDAIVRERCLGLYDFVCCLLEVYADIYVHLYALKKETEIDTETTAPRLLDGGNRDATLGYKILWGIYLDIASFLNVPEHRKEAEYRHAAAILALGDCKVVGSSCPSAKVLACTNGDYGCCICFDDGECEGDDTCEEDTVSSASISPRTEQVKENLFVQLPCGHQFHEDCVIPWLCASVTCPLCRQPVAT